MKKRILSVFMAFALVVLGLSFAKPDTAAAEVNLPFEVAPPQNLTLVYDEIQEMYSPGATVHGLSFTVANDLNQFLIALDEAEDKEAFLANYGLYDFLISIQIDWALDDVNDPVSGWHYNEYWDFSDNGFGFGQDGDARYHIGEWDVTDWGLNNNDTVQEYWVFHDVPNDWRWNGDPETGWVGLKDQLNPDQYEYIIDEDGEGTLRIDFSKHTIYARARYIFWGMTLDGSDRELLAVSDWSNIASSGKEGEKFEVPTELPAPEISNLYLTDKEFNGNPVAAFTLTVPDELAKLAAQMAAGNGGIWIYTQARVKGDAEWTEMGNTDFTIKTGEMECALLHLVSTERPSIPRDTAIEVRCRYVAFGLGLEEDLNGPWSKVLSFGTSDINQGGGEGESATESPTEEAKPNEKKSECWLCHFCPQPLGLCIFIWLLILLIVIVVIVIIVVKSKKNKEKKQQ